MSGDGDVVSELIGAAHGKSKLTPTETARLLQRAADRIRDYREQIASVSLANDLGHGDIVFDLTAMASAIDLFPPQRISAMLVEAAEVLEAAKLLLKEKRSRIEGGK